MNDIAERPESAVSTARIHILLYSDDVHTREQVRVGVGASIGPRQIRWTEVATEAAVFSEVADHDFELLILDGEAAKVGGMGICYQLKHEIYACPPVLLLVGRRDDAWLATWSLAEAAISHPIDPFEVRAAVEEFFAQASAALK
jgi:DNA-binding response OmpR family regulator